MRIHLMGALLGLLGLVALPVHAHSDHEHTPITEEAATAQASEKLGEFVAGGKLEKS